MEQQTQYATALLMTSAGAVLAAVYDIYRSSLKEWRFLTRFSSLLDFGFWVFALIFVFTLLLGVNDGDIRLVVFVLLGSGALIYWKTAHPLVEASTRMIVRFIRRLFMAVYRIFVVLLIRPLQILLKMVRRSVVVLDGALLKLEPLIGWPVAKMLQWVRAGVRAVGRKYLLPALRGGKEHIQAVSNRYRHKILDWLRRGDGGDGEP